MVARQPSPCKGMAKHDAKYAFLSQPLPVNSQQDYSIRKHGDGSRAGLWTLSPLVYEHSTKCNKHIHK